MALDMNDADLDLMIESTVHKVNASSTLLSSKEFHKLNEKLIQSGRISDNKLDLNVVSDRSVGQKADPLKKAQQLAILSEALPTTSTITKKSEEKTLGKGWFDFKPLKMTDDLKRDVRMVQMRNYIDPKRFYKNPDKLGPIIHVGTVIEGPSEYKSARLTKAERKQSLVQEILSDQKVKDYTKKTFLQIQAVKSNKRKAFRPDRKSKPQKKVRSLY